MPSNRSLAGLLVLLLGTGGCADAQHRIVSLNLCTDQLALELAAPSDITALSPLAADCAVSVRCVQARAFQVQRPDGEGLINARPDVVLDGTWHRSTVPLVAQALHVSLVTIPPADALADIPTQVGTVAHAIGRDREGAAVIRTFQARLDHLRPTHPEHVFTAVVLGANLLSDTGGLTRDLLNHAGFREPKSSTSIEGLLANPPDLLVIGTIDEGASLAEQIVHHPALTGRFTGAHRLVLPGRLTLCGLPETLDALARLVVAHDRLTAEIPP